ncbi:MAG: hypothetical protein SVM79_03885 [Chloroflexota bacterium]|nr:hypothetical protein [Chloroflexota bacterium]
MADKRPKIKKAKKSPTKGNKSGKPPRMTTPWGRGSSEYRPVIFIKQYFETHGEACAADIYYALSQEIERLNEERIGIEEKPLRRPNYSSFAKYFHWFKLLGLVEPTDRREPAIYSFLEKRHFYRLTAKGKTEKDAWQDPVRAAHPEFG